MRIRKYVLHVEDRRNRGVDLLELAHHLVEGARADPVSHVLFERFAMGAARLEVGESRITL